MPFNTQWNGFGPAFTPDRSGLYFFSNRPAASAVAGDTWFIPVKSGWWGGCRKRQSTRPATEQHTRPPFPRVGSDFDTFLEEEGLLEDVTVIAVKRYIAYLLTAKMMEENLTKAELARRMETSRSALNRLLDPENSSITLQTLQSAAQALGGRLKIELDFDHAA